MADRDQEIRPGRSSAPEIEMEEWFDHPQIREAFSSLELKYRRYVEATHTVLLVADSSGKLIDVSQSGVHLFGYGSKTEMLLCGLFDRLFADPEAATSIKKRLSEEGAIKDHELEARRKDGSIFTASITINAWCGDDGRVCFEGILTDVTEKRKLERALIETRLYSHQLGESEKRARLFNQHILHMLMIMSHDIRGPLVSMAATLKLLLRGLYGKMDESVANTLRDLLSRVAQLTGLAEDCLGKANSINGSLRVEREVLDLRQDIIDPVLDELSNEIQKRGILIDNRLGAIPAGTIPVKVNRIWLKAVFRNLFQNAIKYGGTGCSIAFGFEDHGTHYRLNVYNSGTPIPEEHRNKLFTKFGRVPRGDRPEQEGVGLGLYLIREITRKHGGDIWYEAKPDGSDFVFTIPKDLPEEGSNQHGEDPDPAPPEAH